MSHNPFDDHAGMKVPGPVVRAPEIPMVLDRFEKAIAHHYETLTHLTQKLEPILSRENQTAKDGHGPTDAGKCTTSLGERLEGLLVKVHGCTGLVRTIINTSEL